jgi:hypothetical protein
LNQSLSGALYGNSVALHGIEIYLPLLSNAMSK